MKTFYLVAIVVLLFCSKITWSQNDSTLKLTGKESCFLNEDALNSLDVSTSYTFETWINVFEYQEFDRIFDRRMVCDLQIIAPKGVGNFGIQFNERKNTSDEVLRSIETNQASEDLMLNTWYHIAVTFDGDSCKLFVDNSLVGLYVDTLWDLSASIRALNIGGKYWDDVYSHQLNGLIDEFRVSNIAREISDMQFSKRLEEYYVDANTIALIHFNEAFTDSVAVESGLGYCGTTGGNPANNPDGSLGYSVQNYSDTLLGSPNFLLRPRYVSKSSGAWADSSSWYVDVDSLVHANYAPGEFAERINIEEGHHITADSITISTDGVFNISGQLTVNDSIKNYRGSDGIVIHSTSTHQGSLIHHGHSLQATIERYIAPYTTNDDGWHLLSCPIADFPVAGSDFTPGPTDDFYRWNESVYTWMNYKQESFDMDLGHGYLCAYDTVDTKLMSGKLNNGAITRSNLTFTESVNDDGWQLLGNPFPSAIQWNTAEWNRQNIVAIAKIWSEETGNYKDVETGDPIPSTQGFFVEVDSLLTGSITIPAEARFHSGSSWNKMAKDNELSIVVTSLNSRYSDRIKVRFNPLATSIFDSDFDSHKLKGSPKAPQLYLHWNQENYSILTLPPTTAKFEIPLNFEATYNTQYTIRVTDFSISNASEIWLEDIKENKIVELTLGKEYNFVSTTQNSRNRFFIHFNKTESEIYNTAASESIKIYSNTQGIILMSSESFDGDITIFDLAGKMVFMEQLTTTNYHLITTELPKGIYILRIANSQFLLSKKVILN